ncbi:MAG: serine--tRNA ligase, partial [Thermotogales bacterium]|nr:serine--tRNA ligase [Thermotogales bacterium]
MLDPKLIRNQLTDTAAQLQRRGFTLDVENIERLESLRKDIQVRTETLQAERNSRSKSIGKAKAAGEDIQPLLDQVAGLGEQLNTARQELEAVQNQLEDILMGIPNIPHESVPAGTDESQNEEL